MLPKADLHIHTTCSDGRLDPMEVVDAALEANLAAFAITDHDTIDGYLLAEKYARDEGIELIPGVEITASMDEKEVHILAYYFDPNSETFKTLLLEQRVGRRQRIKGIISTLIDLGLDINYEEVRAEANGANIGRPHVAQVLIHKGYVGNYFEAFSKYLSTERLGEIKHTYPGFESVIKAIKSAGGASILAHPGKIFSQNEIYASAAVDSLNIFFSISRNGQTFHEFWLDKISCGVFDFCFILILANFNLLETKFCECNNDLYVTRI